MIHDCITAISDALRPITTEPVAVRTDALDQDDDGAALFFVRPLNLVTVEQMGGMRRVRLHFNVRYYPAEDNEAPMPELTRGLVAMTEALRRIKMPNGGQTRPAKGLHGEIVDGVVHVMCGYDFVLTNDAAKTIVQTLELDYKIKGDDHA